MIAHIHVTDYCVVFAVIGQLVNKFICINSGVRFIFRHRQLKRICRAYLFTRRILPIQEVRTISIDHRRSKSRFAIQRIPAIGKSVLKSTIFHRDGVICSIRESIRAVAKQVLRRRAVIEHFREHLLLLFRQSFCNQK